MIPGPVLIIPCPICSFPGKKRTLISGNTFCAELWSDGKKIAPMLPEYPWIVKCKNCSKFFYTNDSRAIHSIHWDDKDSKDWDHVEFFVFPTFEEYFEALGTEVSEKYLRWKAFQSYNDLLRNNKEDSITLDMRDLYFDNLKSLLYLLSEDDLKELFTVIEINRQLGRFEKCKELLNKVDDLKNDQIKSLFLKEVGNKNTRLFRLN